MIKDHFSRTINRPDDDLFFDIWANTFANPPSATMIYPDTVLINRFIKSIAEFSVTKRFSYGSGCYDLFTSEAFR